MTSQAAQRIATTQTSNNEPRLHYLDVPAEGEQKGIILLIHGFPQTSYQFRKVVKPLASQGYRLIIPDYRGAGLSSKPDDGDYTKVCVAEDIYLLVTKELVITEKIHVIGHDIGGMIAYTYAVRHAEHTASVVWGECPLPGTTTYDESRETMAMWHFIFRSVPDLPEALVEGKEEIYLQHFYDRLCYNAAAITQADVEVYAAAYKKPGSMRAGFGIYRTFEQDKKDNQAWLKEHGKSKTPALLLNGDHGPFADQAESMAKETFEGAKVQTVRDSGHWIAEENPIDFVKIVVEFIQNVGSK